MGHRHLCIPSANSLQPTPWLGLLHWPSMPPPLPLGLVSTKVECLSKSSGAAMAGLQDVQTSCAETAATASLPSLCSSRGRSRSSGRIGEEPLEDAPVKAKETRCDMDAARDIITLSTSMLEFQRLALVMRNRIEYSMVQCHSTSEILNL